MKNYIKTFKNLSDFKNRNCKLFISEDALYKVLIFDYNYKHYQVYIKYPKNDYFIETTISSGSSGNGRYTMSGSDVWRKIFPDISVYYNKLNMFLDLGTFDFVFLKFSASVDYGNKFNDKSKDPDKINYQDIEKVLKEKYLQLPSNIKNIIFSYKTSDESKYFVVYDSKYCYDAQKFICITLNGVNEYKITNCATCLDGGTTIINVIDQNNIGHVFHYPTPWSKLPTTWDEERLIENSKEETDKLAEILEIDIEL